MVTDGDGIDDRSRGQVILIGAIALAFIVLGVVVVFNGVLYTETISSGEPSQTGNTAETTGFEVEQGVGCLLVALEGNAGNVSNSSGKETVQQEIETFGEQYRNATAQSTPAVLELSVSTDDIEAKDSNDYAVDHANVTITYDSHAVSYSQTRQIEPDHCSEDEI